jgi:hypothetical protein
VLLGLGHTSRVGKDSVANLLIRDHGFARLAFADPIYSLVYSTRDSVKRLVDDIGWEQSKSVHGFVRRALVDMGSACRKEFGQDVFVELLAERLASIESHVPVVVTDVRYRREVAALKDWGGFLVKISRPGISPLQNHSDQALSTFDDWDLELVNDVPLIRLDSLVDELIHKATQLPTV